MFDTAKSENGNGVSPTLTKAKAIERERMMAWLEERIKISKTKKIAEVVALTPVLAALLLERNVNNRPLSPRGSSMLASDIANGRWEYTGASIVISVGGHLIDGQHRCAQVVATGVSIEVILAFGAKETAKYKIDIGRPKSASNFLAMKEYKYTAALAAAARMVLLYRGQGNVVERGSNGLNPTKTEIVEAVEQLDGLASSIEFVASHKLKPFAGPGPLGFAHFLFRKRATKEAADHFFLKMFEGDSLSRGDPILYCRNRLNDVRGNNNTCAELLFKCWNAHRRGETITKLPMNGKLPKLER